MDPFDSFQLRWAHLWTENEGDRDCRAHLRPDETK